jgi:Bacterial lectin
MKCALVGSAFRAKVLCAIFVIAVAAHLPAQITFNNFSSTTGLTLNGSAARSGNVLRLTPANVGQAGSAWFNTAQPLQQGFTTKFDFQVNGGGDGFAFVIQNQPITESQPNPLNALGAGAGGLGY